jgi:hypothetical protein
MNDETFLGKLEVRLGAKAEEVITYAYNGGTVPAAELNFAKLVHGNEATYAVKLAPYFVTSTNVVAAGIVSEDDGRITCPIADEDLASQINTDWPALASA